MKLILLQIILFFFFFGSLSLFINSNNTGTSTLHNNVIEAIVERGHIYLDGATTWGFLPPLEPWADSFEFKGHIYANKQPASYFIGSVVYFFLYKMGITYKKNLSLVSSLVTLFTSVLMTATMMVLFFNIVFHITRNRFYSFLITCFMGFGTLLLPYSGILHHDIVATFFLFLGFYCLFKRYHLAKSDSRYMVPVAGFCTGLGLFSSNNTLTIILVILLYVLYKRNLKDIFLFTILLLAGLSVSLVFNIIVFDAPFKFPMILFTSYYHMQAELTLSNYIQQIPTKINFYLFSPITAITFYSPIFLISFLGFLLFPNTYHCEKNILPMFFLLSFFQPLIQSVLPPFGWCQYGPRFLIESTPFTMIGLSSFFLKKGYSWVNHPLFRAAIILVGVVSIVICAVGTLGVVYCGYYENAFLNYSKKILSGELPHYTFVPLGVACIIISRVLYLIKYYNRLK